MLLQDLTNIIVEQRAIPSNYLKRYVIIDLYLPKNISDPTSLSLLLINDGQNLDEMNFSEMLNQLIFSNQVSPVFCCGIHCNKDRIEEYATADITDFKGRGKKANAYQNFIVEELIPFLHNSFAVERFAQKSIAGFSMGGLSAIDTIWNYPEIFSSAGVFSGSLWWRSVEVGEGYDDHLHRIMHQKLKTKSFVEGLRFYFMTGSLDETADRNNNGIIDSIDDTLDLVKELTALGYSEPEDITYVNYEDGKHDVATWARAMPAFLLWGWAPALNGVYTDPLMIGNQA